MIDQYSATDAARRCAAERRLGWSEASVTTRRDVVAGEDCWVVATDTPPLSDGPAFMATETDSFIGYLVRVADGRCIGVKLPFGLQLFGPDD